tara:strand:+ start:9063 stop:10565 length:1503 start_codon:yes stop_codon:yes gene_type:complete
MKNEQSKQQSTGNSYQAGIVKPYSFTCPDNDSGSVMYVDRDRTDSALDDKPEEYKLGPNTLHAAPSTTDDWSNRTDNTFPYITIGQQVDTLYVKLNVPGNKIDTKKFYYFQHPVHGPCQVRFAGLTGEKPRAFTQSADGSITYNPAGTDESNYNDLLVPEQWYDDSYDAIRVPGACGIVAECHDFGPALHETTSPCFQIWTTPEKGGDVCCKTSAEENTDNPQCDADKCYHSYECQDDGCTRLDFVPGGADFTSGSAHNLWANSHDDCNSGDGCASKLNLLWIKHKIHTCVDGHPWTLEPEVQEWGILEGVSLQDYIEKLTTFLPTWGDAQKNQTNDRGTKLNFAYLPNQDGDCFVYTMYYGNDYAMEAWKDDANANWGVFNLHTIKNKPVQNGFLPPEDQLHTSADIHSNSDLWPENCCACEVCDETTQALQEDQSSCCETCIDACTGEEVSGPAKGNGTGHCVGDPDDLCECPKNSHGWASAGCDPHICTFFGETYEM